MLYNSQKGEEAQTLETRFPDGVGVPETRDNVVADSKAEAQLVRASFLQSEPDSL
jgi:hypothetical protein